jgi:site-specific recombinase XerD
MTDKARILKPVSPHALRHTFSVNCIKKRISTGALQAMGKGSKSNRGGENHYFRKIDPVN